MSLDEREIAGYMEWLIEHIQRMESKPVKQNFKVTNSNDVTGEKSYCHFSLRPHM